MNIRNLSFCMLVVALLIGCTTDNDPLLPSKSEHSQSIGAHLEGILHSRPELWNSTLQLSEGKTLLFDHALLSSSTHFDTHYKLPYQNATT